MKIICIKTYEGLIPSESFIDEYKQIPEGEFVEVEIKYGKSRSLEQNNLYWACCKEISDNSDNENFNTPIKVSEQCKIACRFVDSWIMYDNKKTGQQSLNIKTKSISFSNCDSVEAMSFFTDAFKYLSCLVNLQVDEFIDHVKSKMQVKRIEKIKTEFKGEVIK